jgi:hypothetical protein
MFVILQPGTLQPGFLFLKHSNALFVPLLGYNLQLATLKITLLISLWGDEIESA